MEDICKKKEQKIINHEKKSRYLTPNLLYLRSSYMRGMCTHKKSILYLNKRPKKLRFHISAFEAWLSVKTCESMLIYERNVHKKSVIYFNQRQRKSCFYISTFLSFVTWLTYKINRIDVHERNVHKKKTVVYLN